MRSRAHALTNTNANGSPYCRANRCSDGAAHAKPVVGTNAITNISANAIADAVTDIIADAVALAIANAGADGLAHTKPNTAL